MVDVLDKLWKPNSYYFNEELGKLYSELGKIKLSPFSEFLIRKETDFLENPFKNNTWKVFYLSFPWLYCIENSYVSTNNNIYLDDIRHYIFSFIRQYPIFNPDSFIWYDHCLAWRTSTFIYFYLKYFSKQINNDEIKIFYDYIIECSKGIRYYINLPKFKGHNHSIFHSLCCLDLSLFFNDIELRNIGIAKIKW